MGMQTKSEEKYFPYSSPIGLLEEFFFQAEWDYEQISEYEIVAEVEGRWCNYRLFALWRHDLECLIFSSVIDLKIPSTKHNEVGILLSLINPRIWLGHFELMPEDEVLNFRYNLLLRGNPGATLEQIEDIITTVVEESDNLYPALQFVLWGGKAPEEAILAAMLDTCGEA